MFGLKDLYEMKAQVEKDVLFAQAKLSVVNEMIEKAQAQEVVEESNEMVEEEQLNQDIIG